MQDEEVNPAERELESALRKLAPATTTIDRDAFLFEAGYRSGTQRVRVWQMGTGVLAVSLCLSLFLTLVLPTFHRAPERMTVRMEESTRPELPKATEPQVVALQTPQNQPAGIGWVADIGRFFAPGNTSLVVSEPSPNYFQLRQAVLTRGLDALTVLPRATGYRPASPRLMDLKPEDFQ
jgi:hypothetical protein